MKRIASIILIALFGSLSSVAQQSVKLLDRLTFSGYGMVSADLHMPSDVPTYSTFAVQRLSISATGTITDKMLFRFGVEFAGTPRTQDFYFQYVFMPGFQVKLGQMKTPFAHDNQVPPFLNPMTTGGTNPTAYFAGIAGLDPLYISASGRDLGLEISGDLWKRMVSYRLMVMNGRGINSRDIKLGKIYGGSL